MPKILSYNILNGGDDRLSSIASIIRNQHPDAVAVLEANSHANAETLARDLEMQLAFGQANSAFHIAWLSRLPIRRTENHRLPVLAKTLLEVEVIGDNGPLRLFATHLSTTWPEDARRLEEIEAILPVLFPHADQPHLLVGDLNALYPGDPVGSPPPGWVMDRETVNAAPRQVIDLVLKAGYVDCYRALHPRSPGYTFQSDCPWLRIDYIFAPPSMAADLLACDVIAAPEAGQASDHFPIWAEFR